MKPLALEPHDSLDPQCNDFELPILTCWYPKCQHEALQTQQQALRTQREALLTQHETLKTQRVTLQTQREALWTQHEAWWTQPSQCNIVRIGHARVDFALFILLGTQHEHGFQWNMDLRCTSFHSYFCEIHDIYQMLYGRIRVTFVYNCALRK